MTFEAQNAADLIPQRPPFVMVDQLVFADALHSHAIFRVPSDHMFVTRGYYSSSGMVESMAQTAAAGTGFLSKKENRAVSVGYIGAVQKLEVFDWPPAESEIRMEISLLGKVLQVSLVSGLVKYAGKIIASCEMKIFLTDPS